MALVIAVVILFILHLMVGSVFVFSPTETLRALFSGPGGSDSDQTQLILWSLRLPRATSAVIVGICLAISGAAFQAVLRNPLADPFSLGVSSGAAVGGVLAVVMGFAGYAAGLGGVLAAFVTAIAGLALIVLIARAQGVVSVGTLLIAGAGVGSFLWALITFILLTGGQDAQRVLFWLLGSLANISWTKVWVMALVCLLGSALLLSSARAITITSVGEESAASMGVDVERTKWIAILSASAMAAATVACVGIVGFIGLFVPHIARRLVGPNLKALLPAAALLGSATLLGADLIAQRILPGRDVNIGIITALIGAPFLIIAMKSSLRRM